MEPSPPPSRTVTVHSTAAEGPPREGGVAASAAAAMVGRPPKWRGRLGALLCIASVYKLVEVTRPLLHYL